MRHTRHCHSAMQARQPLHIVMVQADVAQAVLPQLHTLRQPMGLSVFLMGATPEQAQALQCEGAVVRPYLPHGFLNMLTVMHTGMRRADVYTIYDRYVSQNES